MQRSHQQNCKFSPIALRGRLFVLEHTASTALDAQHYALYRLISTAADTNRLELELREHTSREENIVVVSEPTQLYRRIQSGLSLTHQLISNAEKRREFLELPAEIPNILVHLWPFGLQEDSRRSHRDTVISTESFLTKTAEPKMAKYLDTLGLTETIESLRTDNATFLQVLRANSELPSTTQISEAANRSKDEYIQVCGAIAGYAALGKTSGEEMYNFIRAEEKRHLSLLKKQKKRNSTTTASAAPAQ